MDDFYAALETKVGDNKRERLIIRQTEIFEHPLGFWYMVLIYSLRRRSQITFRFGVNRKMRTSCKVTTYGIFYLK